MKDVAILMGSDSDWERGVKAAAETLKLFGVDWEAKVLSAHRTPKEVQAYVENTGAKIYICCAGMAAHLAGVVAAHTISPVLGVPMPGGMMDGLDALLSTVQMPPGMPVATFGVGKSGAKNAALFAVQILGQNNSGLRADYRQFRIDQRAVVLEKSVKL